MPFRLGPGFLVGDVYKGEEKFVAAARASRLKRLQEGIQMAPCPKKHKEKVLGYIEKGIKEERS